MRAIRFWFLSISDRNSQLDNFFLISYTEGTVEFPQKGGVMLNPMKIEETYREFTNDLSHWAHDGILSIDLQTLYDQGLLECLQEDNGDPEDLTQYFHVIESVEKVTLFNEQFIIWIIPKMESEQPTTFVMIALNHPEKATLEIVFTTRGVYNTPRYVLKVLQHFLLDMLETEATLTSFEKNA